MLPPRRCHIYSDRKKMVYTRAKTLIFSKNLLFLRSDDGSTIIFFPTRIYAGVCILCTAAVSTVNLRDGGSSSSGSCECYTWMQRVWTLWLQKWPSIWRLTCTTSTSCVSQNAHTYLGTCGQNALIICHKKSHTHKQFRIFCNISSITLMQWDLVFFLSFACHNF